MTELEHYALAVVRAVKVTATREAVIGALQDYEVAIRREERASWRAEREQLTQELIACRLHLTGY